MRDRKYSKYSKLVYQIIRQFFNFHQQAAFYPNSGNTNKIKALRKFVYS